MAFTRMGDVKLTRGQLANRVVWVRALLSGDYEQGRKRLRTKDNTWCCLGVAGHCIDPTLAVVAEGSPRALLDHYWAEKNLGLVFGDQNTAAAWNDRGDGLSFGHIADRIALATDKNQSFEEADDPPELRDEEPGDYVRDWLEHRV